MPWKQSAAVGEASHADDGDGDGDDAEPAQ